MAAHAAAQSGWDFRIYSRKIKSQLYGAQYLHAPIPNVPCGEPKLVRYALFGTPEMYRRKVYGDSWDGTTSPEDLETSHGAWDIRKAYDYLWFLYQNKIQDLDLRGIPDVVHELPKGHDLVISSVPRTIWRQPFDIFEAQQIWALGDTEVQRIFYNRPDPFTVICNGYEETPWYRTSNMYGYATMEWPCKLKPYVPDPNDERAVIPAYSAWQTPPVKGASIVEKPLRHNSKAAADFVHVGRYGKWEKGVLSSDAFTDAMKAMANDAI